MNQPGTLTIQQMAAQTGLSEHTLRYYERVGLLDSVERDPSSGHRRYAEHNLQLVGFLKCLRGTGMPIRGMQEYVRLMHGGDATIADRIALLEEHQRAIEKQLAELEQNLAAIKKKIAWYRQYHESRSHALEKEQQP